ncbi:MAG: stage V sporulation protein S [Bacillus thermozeamaize]|uniref:Stage V sporulation protein S n=1 Tax=Bacillus thermozeamaize TaxID=230954 RepID=A0A1Y3PH20_9BACI|nr:MAG: stage V sporulation protein S [Bacillus thermozeamaize]
MATVQTKEKIPSVLRVSAKSKPNAVAGALVAAMREHGVVELQAVGAAATNQATKAVAIARGFFAQEGRNITCVPAFTEVQIDGEAKTGIKLIVS